MRKNKFCLPFFILFKNAARRHIKFTLRPPSVFSYSDGMEAKTDDLQTIHHHRLPSPPGWLGAAEKDHGCCLIGWGDAIDLREMLRPEHGGALTSDAGRYSRALLEQAGANVRCCTDPACSRAEGPTSFPRWSKLDVPV